MQGTEDLGLLGDLLRALLRFSCRLFVLHPIVYSLWDSDGRAGDLESSRTEQQLRTRHHQPLADDPTAALFHALVRVAPEPREAGNQSLEAGLW